MNAGYTPLPNPFRVRDLTPEQEALWEEMHDWFEIADKVALFTTIARFLAARDAKMLEDAAQDFPGFAEVQTHGDAVRWLRARAAELRERA